MTARNENATPSSTDAHGIAAIAKAVFAPLVKFRQRRRTAKTFAMMSDKLLNDIGIDRGSIDAASLIAHPTMSFDAYVAGIRAAVAATSKAWATEAALHDVPPHLRRDMGLDNENNTTVAELMGAYRRRVDGALVDPLIENTRIANDISRRVA